MVNQLLATMKPISVVAEFIAMTIFIYIGCGTVMSYLAPSNFEYNDGATEDPSYQAHINSTFGVVVPFVFGLTVTMLVYAASLLQAGHLNPTVTLGLLCTGKIGYVHAGAMACAQIIGSMFAVGLLTITLPNAQESTYGANSLSAGVSKLNGIIGEAFLTFVLVSVVLLMSNSEYNAITAPIAIGVTVFVAHGVLLPIDGCSINPARSFGPAVASGAWSDFWIFVVAPFAGALVAIAVFKANIYFFTQQENQQVQDPPLTQQNIPNHPNIQRESSYDFAQQQQVEQDLLQEDLGTFGDEPLQKQDQIQQQQQEETKSSQMNKRVIHPHLQQQQQQQQQQEKTEDIIQQKQYHEQMQKKQEEEIGSA
eukprot:TRINITY_DN583_c0_g1_i2.p1 TRINITY_DN583_c0_g1~~TRINITY_DN583_c0_g1_i2.p1  ORF type:complete len:366 (-),score=50.56 TRINITY_DN583_c0_g1_i2:782-1879(-)